MANRKELIEIIKTTPIDQAIMLSGQHGIGKSETLKGYFESQGYSMITLFVGQMADAGDLIGLPDRTEVEVNIGGKLVKQKITEFCPPKWFPLDPDAKVIVFFDEVNRGKPEIMQCLMDMVLNRKLNGLELPKHTRIVGAINPSEDGYYQVEDLDPAFLNRWNRYDFTPSIAEWSEWAFKANVNKLVIDFINKNSTHLDPPSSKSLDNESSQEIYASRRSWVKVSDYLNFNEVTNPETLQNYLMGCVGARSTSVFMNFMKESQRGLDCGTILMKWNKKIASTINKYNAQEIIYQNQEMAVWIKEHITDLKETNLGVTVCDNLKKYFDIIPPEQSANFMEILADATAEQEEWPTTLMTIDNSIADRMLRVRRGDDELDEF